MSAETSSKPNIFSESKKGPAASLEEIIAGEIRSEGPVSFARFMELALYHPQLGYYERHTRQTGRSGDFYTSVSVGSLYGELLAFEFVRLLEALPGPVQLVESGAHDGELARDILNYLRQYCPALFERLGYWIIEPSAARREQQRSKLEPFGGRIKWHAELSGGLEFRGICFSNELLDAMPFHVFRWSASAQHWREWGVGLEPNRLGWAELPSPSDRDTVRLLPDVPPELGEVLPDGYAVEVSPAAVNWWGKAACALREGFLWTADYGLTQEEMLRPERKDGTLRGYHRHQATREVLQNPGEQDLTAHVNFSRIIQAGERRGLTTEGLMQQGLYLKGILERIQQTPEQFPLWTPMRYRQLSSLIHPEHLGRAFRILVQRRS